ncbi:MAG TPA: decarboxylase [Burkholderiales bacterium]
MLAEELIALYDTAREARPFTETHPGLTPAAGYEAAAALHRHRLAQGWKPVGRKIGFTNRTIWPRYGVFEPIWGTVYDRTAGFAEHDRGTIPLAGLLNPRIEPEICFRLKAAPRGAGLRALLDAIEWVAHSIEIVQSRFPGWKFQLADCTAANGLHGRLLVGTPRPLSELPQLAEALPAVSIELLKEGALVDRGVGANVLDSPLAALGHLVEALARQPDAAPLAAGEIISTGTLTDAHAVRPGETWSTRLAGLPLPGLSVRFA